MWTRIEVFQILERIHQVHFIERTSKGMYGPATHEHKFKQLPDLIICGLKFLSLLEKAPHKNEKQEWANEKPKFDNARKLRGIYFGDPEDG